MSDPTPRAPHLRGRALTLALAAGALLTLAGCAGSGADANQNRQPPATTLTPDPATSSELETKMREIAAAMEASHADNARVTPGKGANAPGAAWEFADEPASGGKGSTSAISTGATEVSVEDDAPTTIATPPVVRPYAPTAAESQAKLAHELAAVLQGRIAAAEDVPLDLLLRLAALDAIEPGIFNTYFPGGSGRMASGLLTEDELAFLVRYRDLLESLRATTDGASAAGVRDLIGLVDHAAQDLVALDDLRIRRALLCRRVETIGRYDEMERYGNTYKLVAGESRGHRAIVYVEPVNFTNELTSRKGVPGFGVELEQDLLLYRLDEEADMLAWQLLDQKVSEFSTVRRRDFFLTCVVSLPPTLSVGKYRLKVMLRDIHTGAVAEETINVEMVANAAALHE